MSMNIGSIVHYTSRGSMDGIYAKECRAAIVTEIGDNETVGLQVFNPEGIFVHSLANRGCPYDEGSGTDPRSCDGRDHAGGSWHLPHEGI